MNYDPEQDLLKFLNNGEKDEEVEDYSENTDEDIEDEEQMYETVEDGHTKDEKSRNNKKKSRNDEIDKDDTFQFVNSVSGISTLIFKDQLLNEKQKQNIILSQQNTRIQDRNFDDLENVQKAAKCLEIIKCHDNEICKEIHPSVFKQICIIDFKTITHLNIIDFSILIDYYCLAIVYTLIDQQKTYNKFKHHELNVDHLCNLYDSCDIIEKIHKHNVNSIIYRLEGTNLAIIFNKITKACKVLKIENTSRDANVKLKSDVTNKKIKKKNLILYSLEFKDSKQNNDNINDVDVDDDDMDTNKMKNKKQSNASKSKKSKISDVKFENCMIRIEKGYEQFINAFIAFCRFPTLISTQWKICTVGYKNQFVNLIEKVEENKSIKFQDYPEMMITMLKQRNLYKQCIYTINSKIEKCNE